MDLFCHVKQVSVARYKRTKIYEQGEALVKLIRGGEQQAAQWKEQEKDWREGLTASTNKELIILWEVWERVDEGWLVRTFSPSQPTQPRVAWLGEHVKCGARRW